MNTPLRRDGCSLGPRTVKQGLLCATGLVVPAHFYNFLHYFYFTGCPSFSDVTMNRYMPPPPGNLPPLQEKKFFSA